MRLIDADELINNIKVEFGYLTDDNLILVPMRDVHKSIKEAPTVKEKYRWHDLRKNPNDLPEKNKWVMCYCQGRQYQVMRQNHVTDWETWYPSVATFMASFVIAWREIEPFGEVEE